MPQPEGLASEAHAVLIFVAYGVVALVGTLALFRQRDIRGAA